MTTISLDDRRLAVPEQTEPLDAVPAPPPAPPAPPPPATSGRFLVVDEPEQPQLTIALTRPITHIGRGFAASIQLEDKCVSRRHAIVTQRRGTARILDDRSSNGTYVNGRRVAEAELRDGDVIVLGRVVLVFRDISA
jgi:pSer/pThr/pTyr-binding forkhead associated (FHA) protein